MVSNASSVAMGFYHSHTRFLPRPARLINFVSIDSFPQAIASASIISKSKHEPRRILATRSHPMTPKLTWCTCCICALSHNELKDNVLVDAPLTMSYKNGHGDDDDVI